MRFNIFDSGIDIETGIISDSFEDALRSAIIVSFLTDKRAGSDDAIPDAPIVSQTIPLDRRGWAGDALSEINGDRIGSHLWLLSREKKTDETLRRAVEYAEESISWLIDDGFASSVFATAEWIDGGRLNLQISVILTSGESLKTVLTVGATYAI
jgi:phage gp46-like protein